ncbi:NTP pyrophosphohydrolase [Cylindrospermum stagnale PCC 7417]|uniref:NTP pyrophosphohydrolase n=1 Tax=Cylindrospermum stagnale PCC 7417 TaxID=56107 RepID=K9X2I2_9NOST|nr:NUDIX hydrolase [Cylindrospermum stagnale]AFZ26855.1 NTP pyrophosphohydrolase [Cylindrospermum stagnale PCC 7417]
MNNLKKWKTIKSKMVLDHHWCKVRQDEIELPNGKIIDDYFVCIKPDIALILPITSSREIVFVRQYRHAVGEFFLELPAGSFNPTKESAQTAAIRELAEETGYIAQDVIKIGTLYDKPSKDTNQIHLFLAENVSKAGEQNLDITEEIEVVLIPIESVLDKIAQGEISVAGTVAALFLGLNFLMKKEYDFSQSVKNPYIKKVKN